MSTPLHWIVPGPLDQRTGGYVYDRRIVDGLRAAGRQVRVHELAGRFPDADRRAVDAATEAVALIGDGLTVIDGLALPAFRDLLDRLPQPWVGLIHHPLAMETGLDEAEAAAYFALERHLLPRAGRLIVTSPRTRQDLEEFAVDVDKIAVVVPGVEPAAPARGSGSERPTALLTVGTLTPRKGHLVLLSALAELLDLDWHLTAVGSGAWDPDHAARVAGATEELRLSERVTMIGEQDEKGLAAFYDRADLFVLASHHEGYGMVLAEALARGLPIVSTTAGAIPDTVPARAGRLVPPGDPGALAAALRSVLTDGEIYHRLREGALAARADLPGWHDSAVRFDRVLQAVIGA